MRKVLLFSFFLRAALSYAKDNPNSGVIETVKVDGFNNLNLQVQATGLRVGDNIFVFDPDLSTWVVRSAAHSYVGYYDPTAKTTNKWFKFTAKTERRIRGGEKPNYDLDFDTTSIDSIYAFMVQGKKENKKIVEELIQPVNFNPFENEGAKGFSLQILPSSPEAVTNVPGPPRVIRKWTVGNLQITSTKKGNAKLEFMSSTVDLNDNGQAGIVRQTVFSYQKLSAFAGGKPLGELNIVRLPADQAPLESEIPGKNTLDLSWGNKIYFTPGAVDAFELDGPPAHDANGNSIGPTRAKIIPSHTEIPAS